MNTKKMFYLLAAAVVLPAAITSCSAKKEEIEAEPLPVPKKEVKAEPAVEVKPAPVPEKKAEVKPAPVPEKKTEVNPAPVPEKKAEVKPVKQAPVLPCKHTVVKGDSLWKISVQYYGKGSKWTKIHEANKAVIKNWDFLVPGTVLNIPADK